jgi:TatA/E family protein of Tat protein translocase
MFGIGGWEMLLIGVVALLVFGPKRLPELARSLGKGLAEFRKASSELRRSIDLDLDPTRLSAPEPEKLPPAQAGDPAIHPDDGAAASAAKGAAIGASAAKEAREGALPLQPAGSPDTSEDRPTRGD